MEILGVIFTITAIVSGGLLAWRIQSQARNGYLIYNCKFADKVPVITVVVMSEPCISKSAHNYNCSLYDTKEELQQLQVTQGIPIFVGIKNN